MTTPPVSACVIGAGSWGTALAVILTHNLPAVRLVGHNTEAMTEMAKHRENQRYLPGVPLPDNLHIETNLAALADSGHFILATPSHAFRPTLRALRNEMQAEAAQQATLIWGTKGFDPDSGQLLSEVAAAEFPGDGPRAVISGPSFAAEAARGLPTALTLACANRDSDCSAALAGWFRTPSTRVYYSNDMIGVQLGGAAKNVMAIAAGISDGLGFGANARAALITRGLAELTRLGVALGGKADTFTGLTGVGDLILTCTDDQSRNRRFGLGIGKGLPAAQVRADIGQEIEGINSARELHHISQKLGVEMPITEQVHRILHHNHDPKIAVRDLLSRDAKAEHWAG